ncbi:hypothetical protein SEA_STEAMY_79 [Mycobacterium phage Steamy]|uniref:Uncharacterized protein n=1 Tax=Mycobacterium phage Steamy TaxID=2250309 RepID=A0A345L0Q1_9CAUD|nr:hypothetical protein KIV62_gp22 [Mycobacterium phage Steamy]AXH48853.1 hypothetical protein SEA_STEAMY_79 [Mycobacterium phage Steamy]
MTPKPLRVFVYWNLHRKMWSVKALEGPDKGRVVLRTNGPVVLRRVTAKVSEAGRQRVLREGKKNVHAGIVGEYMGGSAAALTPDARLVTYRPYLQGHFTYTDDGSKYEGSDLAILDNKRVYVA